MFVFSCAVYYIIIYHSYIVNYLESKAIHIWLAVRTVWFMEAGHAFISSIRNPELIYVLSTLMGMIKIDIEPGLA